MQCETAGKHHSWLSCYHARHRSTKLFHDLWKYMAKIACYSWQCISYRLWMLFWIAAVLVRLDKYSMIGGQMARHTDIDSIYRTKHTPYTRTTR